MTCRFFVYVVGLVSWRWWKWVKLKRCRVNFMLNRWWTLFSLTHHDCIDYLSAISRDFTKVKDFRGWLDEFVCMALRLLLLKCSNFKSENLVDIFNLALKFKTNPIPSPTSYLYIYCITSLRTPHNNGTLIKNFRRNITTSIQLDHSAFNAQ